MFEVIACGGLVGFEVEWHAFDARLRLIQVGLAASRVSQRLALLAARLERNVF